jgi:hypothetical protein
MGVVYEAHDREENSRVALKTLRTLTGEGVLHFKREFRALADLAHRNLVALGELVEEDGRWFFTMELVDGVDFLGWVRPGLSGAEADSGVAQETITLDPVTARDDDTRLPAWEGAGTLDEGRLRAALRQLAEGLSVLHAAGKVHRDVKPSNVLVTRAGRLVLLDFGLVADSSAGDLGESPAAGTPDFVAPEQAAGKTVGPAADWYGVGVMLYAALTGQLPFQGGTLEVLRAKMHAPPRPPRELAPHVPPDLEALCVALLAADPAARAGAHEVLAAVGAAAHGVAPEPVRTPFVGRAAELAILDEAFAASCAGEGTSVLLCGESGLGKSTLVRRFLSRLRERAPECWILQGRCYERESVPYKAFDGAIDSLSQIFHRLPPETCRALLPPGAALLGQAFPVLGRIEAVAACAPIEILDAPERRGRVFEALRELLGRVRARWPVVLVVDDLQWADADSLALLAALLRPPEAPPLLFLATQRAVDGREPSLDVLPGSARRVDLERLPADAANELAARLAAARGGGAGLALAIAEEAAGHPLFIDALVRHTLVAAPGLPAASGAGLRRVQLDEALRGRVAALEPPAEELLALTALAGGPMPLDVAAHATGAPRGEVRQRAALLRTDHLARIAGTGAATRLEPYHDRVTAAVLAGLPAKRVRALHTRLAAAFEAAGSDAELVATHLEGAGQPTRAVGFVTEAAAAAVRALAFDRAARLYARALALGISDPVERRRVGTELGESLSNLGRAADAARAFLDASGGAPPEQRLGLERRAAEQFLRAGLVDEGRELAARVLAAVGMASPRTPRRALLGLVGRRLQIRVRGLGFHERAEADVLPADLERIDVCWSMAAGLGFVDMVRGAYFQARHILLALEAGEPYRVSRALVCEAAFQSTAGGPGAARTSQLLDQADALARRLDHPHALALVIGVRGLQAFNEGRFAGSVVLCDRAASQLRSRCANAAWEMAMCELTALTCVSYLGDLPGLARLLPRRLREAEERSDHHALVSVLTAQPALHWLAADDLTGGRACIARAEALLTRDGFHFQHYLHLYAAVQLELYAGEGARAHERMETAWPLLESSLLLRGQQLRHEALHLRARAALAAAAEDLAGPERGLRAVEREAMPWSIGLARLGLAGIAARRGELPEARALVERAAGHLDQAGMALHAAVARLRGGELMGGAPGRTLAESAAQELSQLGVARPHRMARLMAPGFAHLAERNG